MDKAVWNPHNKPLDELPFIYGFNNGSGMGGVIGCLIAEDGTPLGSHACSHEGWMLYDLGIYEGKRPDRHKDDFQKHYPDGYRMDFVSYADVKEHSGLQAAFAKNKAAAPATT